MNDKKLGNLFEKLKNNKTLQRILIISFAVIVSIILLVTTFKKDSANIEETYSADTVVAGLESRLSKTLSLVDGAGDVSVVITVESGMETVLAMKTTTVQTINGVETTETPILVNGKTVVLKENYPKIKGVLIVAEGAKNLSVLSRIQQATVSLLSINPNQIEILTMK